MLNRAIFCSKISQKLWFPQLTCRPTSVLTHRSLRHQQCISATFLLVDKGNYSVSFRITTAVTQKHEPLWLLSLKLRKNYLGQDFLPLLSLLLGGLVLRLHPRAPSPDLFPHGSLKRWGRMKTGTYWEGQEFICLWTRLTYRLTTHTAYIGFADEWIL